MSPADPNTPEVEGGGRFSPEESRCPVITVLSANEHGVVIESRKAFESGATIALGLHVAIPDAGQSEFIAAKSSWSGRSRRFPPTANASFE